MTSHPPFFIVGCGRSGTTLLRTMLNHHPQVAIPLESLFMVDYLRAAPSIPITVLASILLHDYEFHEWGMPITHEDLAGCQTAQDIMDRIHDLYQAQEGKSRWGQKTPRFVRHGDLLKSVYPAAKFIHLLRDPRAVTLSLMRSNLHRSNAYFGARRWLMDVRAGQTLKSTYPDDVLELRYEDLVTEPESTLHTVCDFLSLPFDTSMLAYDQTGTREYQSIFDQIHQGLHEPPRAGRIDAWRQKLSPRDQEVIETLCAETMREVGYQPELPSPHIDPTYVRLLKRDRALKLLQQIMHRVFRRPRELYSFVWRKLRLGLLWHDLREVNY
jgi:hypothetical protein